MLKQHRCTTCSEYVNCSRRKSRKRKFLELDEDQQYDHDPRHTAVDVVCGNCDKTVEKELDILRRNVQFLAGRRSTASTKSAPAMVCFVISEAEKITAHQSILAGVSPVFQSMFSVGMLEKETGKVSITDASLSTMETVVRYCYTADITFTVDIDLDEVTHISHKYEISSLKDRCETEHCNRFQNSMKITVDLSTALGVTEELLVTADRYEMERLRKTCLEELHLRNYIAKQKYEMDTPRKASCVKERRYLVDDRTSPRALAKLARLSFKFGTEGMQDEIYRTIQGLSDEDGKQVWTEVMSSSVARKD